MIKYATTDDYDKISALIFNGDNHVGSGCLLWSEDNNILYCITANHCCSDNTIIKSSINGDLHTLSTLSEKIYSDTDDIAIYQILVNDYTRTIPRTMICNLSNQSQKVHINGYPINSGRQRVAIEAVCTSNDESKIYLNVSGLDSCAVERFDEVKGISGSGCYDVVGKNIRFMGIENKAINNNVPFKVLHAINFDRINSTLLFNKLPPLPQSTPLYMIDPIGSYKTVEQALMEYNFQNKWAELEIYQILKTSIESHVNSENLSLYLCGMSGIGKTRGVLNVCRQLGYNYTIYYDNFRTFNDEKRKLQKHANLSNEKFFIIIDEVEFKDFTNSNSEFEALKKNFKLIFIGTVPKEQPNVGYSDIIYMDLIGKNDVIKVVSEQYPSLTSEELDDIYHLSYNDLRLAILISRLYCKDKFSTTDFSMPILSGSARKLRDNFSSVESILEKTIAQHKGAEPYKVDITESFNRLSLFVDIGIKSEVEDEIHSLSVFFDEKNSSKFKLAIRHLLNINLGIEKLNYFELSPRALAKLAFEQQGWELIRDNMEKFMESIPNNLLRKRFFDRVSECAMTKEVNEALASWFRKKYKLGALDSINHNNAKEIMMYIEYSPLIGLNWLKDSILKESADRIKQFSGRDGRREILWTCEKLANFKECFFDCEEIFYKLAQNENEIGISNNSQGVWSSMFSPILSNTEVPYLERFEILCNRALGCNQEYEFSMFESAFSSALNFNGGTRISPPDMVGGVITPPSWNPKTFEEIIGILNKFLEQILGIYDKLNKIMQDCILEVFKNNLSSFLLYGLLSELKETLRVICIDQQQKNKLIIKLEWQIRLQEKSMHESSKKIIYEINRWIDELEDKTLQGKIDKFISRGSYSYGYNESEKLKWEQEILTLATEIMEDESKKEILHKITNSTNSNSDTIANLAETLAKIENENLLFDFIELLLNSNKCNSFLRGFFLGVYRKKMGLPEKFIVLLDEMQNKASEFVLWATICMDISERGFHRIINLIDLSNDISVIRNMGYKEWFSLLDNEQKIVFLNKLLECTNSQKYVMCFDVILGWISQGDDFDKLFNLTITAFRQCLEEKEIYEIYIITELFKKFPQKYNNDIIELIISIFDFNKSYSSLNHYILEVIDSIKTEYNEKLIMENFGEKLLKSEKQIKGPAKFGFFNRFKVSIVLNWISVNELERAPLIAYHLDSPTIQNERLSTLTMMVLRDYDNEEVYESFILGRYNFKVYKPVDYYNHKEEWYILFKNYEKSNIIALRKWSEYEKNRIENICSEHESNIVEISRYE